MKRVIVAGFLLFAFHAQAYLLDSTQKTENKIKRHLARARALEDASHRDALHKEFVGIQETVMYFEAYSQEARALRASVDDFSCVGLRCAELGYYQEAALIRDFCWPLLDCAYLVENRALLRSVQFNEKFSHAVRSAAVPFGKLLTLVGCSPLPLPCVRGKLDVAGMVDLLERRWKPLLEGDWLQAVRVFGEERALVAHLAQAVQNFLRGAQSAQNSAERHIIENV